LNNTPLQHRPQARQRLLGKSSAGFASSATTPKTAGPLAQSPTKKATVRPRALGVRAPGIAFPRRKSFEITSSSLLVHACSKEACPRSGFSAEMTPLIHLRLPHRYGMSAAEAEHEQM
jgi:hypothetical protein